MHHAPMVFTVADTVRARTYQALTQSDTPLTAAQLADRVPTGGVPARQIYRALQQLEEQGLARCQPGSPITWTAT